MYSGKIPHPLPMDYLMMVSPKSFNSNKELDKNSHSNAVILFLFCLSDVSAYVFMV